MDTAPNDPLATVLAMTATARHPLLLGWGPAGPTYAQPGHGVLVIGPPRSGKTTSVVIPNVLAAAGPVVVASTKPDVLEETSPARSRAGDCLLYDPSGTVMAPRWVERVAWSPLAASRTWDGALLMAQSMTEAARPGGGRGDAAHWTERGTALLAVVLHSGALGEEPFSRVLSAVDRRSVDDVRYPLARHNADLALDLFEGITKTDSREQSGIWSTASSILSGYRSEAALRSTEGTPLDPARLLSGMSTLYLCAGSDRQRQAAPLIAGLVRELRTARYAMAAELGPSEPPLVLVLDELANIAPLHDLPTLVAEGGGQGVLTLACLQDLSQAAARWGDQDARGFLTLFGSKVIFPGIGDTDTLQRLSVWAGEHDVPTTSFSAPEPRGWAAILNRRPEVTRTDATRSERRLPPDVIARGRPGSVLCLSDDVAWVSAEPWFRCSLLRAAGGRGLTLERGRGLEAARSADGPGRGLGF